MPIFKRNKQPDPFNHLLNNTSENSKLSDHTFLEKVATKTDNNDEFTYNSPFRTSQDLVKTMKVKSLKFPLYNRVSNSNTTVLPGSKAIDKSLRKAKDLVVPKFLSSNQEKQKEQLEKLEFKENHLKYLKECQQIVDVSRSEKKELGELNSDGNINKNNISDSEIPSNNEYFSDSIIEKTVNDSTIDESVENDVSKNEDIDESVKKDVGKNENINESVKDSNLSENNVVENETQNEKTSISVEKENVSTKESVTSVSSIKKSKSISSLNSDTQNIKELMPEKIDINEAPRVPFKSTSGVFALWKWKWNEKSQTYPLATPEDPELIIRTDKGYMSKVVYDKLLIDEKIHAQNLEKYKADHIKKYNSTEEEYHNKISSLQNEIDDINTEMEQLKLSTHEKIKLSDIELSKKLLDMNAAHINSKNDIFKRTELIKQETLSSKAKFVSENQEICEEVNNLEATKKELENEFENYQNDLTILLKELDEKTDNLKRLTHEQTKLSSEIDILKQKKRDLEDEAEKSNNLHKKNQEILQNINNKDYLSEINEIDVKISNLLTSLTLVKQETLNQQIEFSSIVKKMEKENEEENEELIDGKLKGEYKGIQTEVGVSNEYTEQKISESQDICELQSQKVNQDSEKIDLSLKEIENEVKNEVENEVESGTNKAEKH